MFNNNNNSISQTNENLFEYLINKLDSRIKKISKNKNFIISIENINFFPYKKELINLMNDLEEDLKQALFAIKALLTENKSLTIENNNLNEKNIKLNEKNNFLNVENENLKLEFNINDNKILNTENLEHKNLFKKSKIENKNNKKFNDFSKLNLNENKKINKNELLIKITKSPQNISILNKEIGNDFMNKLLNDNCSRDYLKNIQNILNRNKSENKLIPKNLNIKKSLNNSFSLNQKKILKNINFTFENSLRNYPKTNNNNLSKRFNNYTNPYGKYFD
jgi:hypothetical protein